MSKEQYDGLWASAWGDMQTFGPVHRHSLNRLVATVSRLSVHSVLDVGCGSGQNYRALASANTYRLAGVDISDTALEKARIAVPGVELHLMDVQAERLQAKFDLVISLQVVEHVPDDVALMRNMRLMTDHYVMISTVQGKMRPSDTQIGHLRTYSSSELVEKIRGVGLRPVRVEQWGFPFYSPLYRTAVEWLPGKAPSGPMGRTSKLAATFLYHLYRLNITGKGDVLTVLAEVDS